MSDDRDPDDPPRRRRPTRPPEDDDDFDEPRPRRRRRPDDRDDESPGAVESLIPYKNAKALVGYYLGFLALLPAVGLLVGPVAVVFSILGIRHANRNPRARGMGHAIVGLVLGLIGFFVMGPVGVLLLYVAFAVK